MRIEVYNHRNDIPNSLCSNYVRTLCQNGDQLWIGTARDGVFHYNPGTHECQRISLSRENAEMDDIKAICFSKAAVDRILYIFGEN